MERALAVGLEPPEYAELRARVGMPVLSRISLPRIKVDRGVLLVEREGAVDHFLPVSKVIFHGIFKDDFDFITALALWGGPCLPDASGMMDCRLRLSGLVRALRVSRFNTMPRSFAAKGISIEAARDSVAKWGNWHCGENKEMFRGRWEATEATVIEEFVLGHAVRIVLVGDKPWQVRLAGEGWKKSIHPESASYMPIDPELLEDTRKLQAHFRLDVIGVDYMVGDDGAKHLLEVNHIPNVTRFPEIRSAYLDHAAGWLSK